MYVSHSNYFGLGLHSHGDMLGFTLQAPSPEDKTLNSKEAPEPAFTKEGWIIPGGVGNKTQMAQVMHGQVNFCFKYNLL